MAEPHSNAGIDLEKELTCSICADVLYQPLTLLDCLHTFCGACLKEWFTFQASQSTSSHPYTCPSCRATVRGTRPDAKVNTLLDLWLQANPSRGKSEQEKEAERKKYRPGDNVLPKLRRRRASESSEDRRLIREVRELSLREAAAPRSRRGPSTETRRREQSHGRRSRSSSHHHASRHSETHRSAGRLTDERSSREPSPRIPPGRQIEHQSSLRSLLSISDDPAAVEEEIRRQIVEEGLLDSLDLSNLDVTQEDEISERIAAAYRRRQTEQRRERRSRGSRTSNESETGRSSDETADTERRRHRPSEPSVAHPAHPPVSRPHLMDAVNQGHALRRMSASQSSSQVTPSQSLPGNLTDMSSTTARSAVNLSTNTTGAGNHRRGLSHSERRATDPQEVREGSSRSLSGSTHTSAPTTPRSAQFDLNAGQAQRPTAPSAGSTPRSPRIGVTTVASENHTRPSNHSSSSLVSTQPAPLSQVAPASHARTHSSTNQSQPMPFAEPSISCNRCGIQEIQYNLHYNCQRCEGGRFNLCLRCYRLSRGCLHWYGFGQAARQEFERQAPAGGYSSTVEPPHVLTGHRYLRPRNTPAKASTTEPSRTVVLDDDPANRLQVGVFCDICFEFANSCYWKCDFCNEGEWGYCNSCVNQGKHCTHALLPLKHKRSSSGPQPSTGESNNDQPNPVTSSPNGSLHPGEQTTISPVTPNSASILDGTRNLTVANLVFRPLTFSGYCDICTYPIPSSRTRFHCPKCNNGDYDICTSCYTSLVARGGIKPTDGHQGWRRCPKGHRMVVIGFEDRDGGRRRIVVNDLVGGHALKEDEVFGPISNDSNTNGTSGASRKNEASWTDPDGTRQTYRFSNSMLDPSRRSGNVTLGQFPPDGGVGLRLIADFTFCPAEGATDELCFPGGAEIREAENINGDWLWGVYCGSKGLLPGNYVHRR